VSVIIPTHNRAALLGDALDSVLDQPAAPPVEILVVADRCTDDTVATVERRQQVHSRIRLLERRAGGAAAARNAGMAEAAGDLLTFLDDDDRWLPGKLATQAAYLSARPEVGVVGCQWLAVRTGRPDLTFRDPERLDERDLLWCNFLGGCTPVMIRRSAVPADELRFDESMPTCEDWDLWLRLARHTAVAVAPEVLAEYRVHGSARLSDQLADPQRGRAAFVRRHAAEMGEVCLAYHRIRQGLAAAHGPAARTRLALEVGRTAPPASWWLAGGESAAARLGRARRDPALGPRWLHRALRRRGDR
jgi:hypothetical protein